MVIIYILYAYLLIGLLFALYFVFYKIQKIDEAAHHTPLLFKLLILQGCIVLWPLLITQKTHLTPMTNLLRKYHFFIWIAIAVVLVIAIIIAYFGSVTINKS